MTAPRRMARRSLIINPMMQKRVMLAVTIFPGMALAIMMSFVCYFCYSVYEQAIYLNVQFDYLIPLFLSIPGFVVLTALVMLMNALFTSHRIAGPAYRISSSIKQLREGDVGFTVKLRPDDYLMDVADELNLLLDSLNENPPAGFTTRAMKAAAKEEAAALADGGPADGRPDAAREATTDDAELADCGAIEADQPSR